MYNFLGMTALACSLMFSVPVYAHQWGCGDGLKQMINSLELVDAQKEQIKPIMAKLKLDMQEIGPQIGILDKQISQHMDAEKMDLTTLDGLVDQKSALIGQMIKVKIKTTNEIFMVLNPTQKMQLKEAMKKSEDKMAAQFKHCQEQD